MRHTQAPASVIYLIFTAFTYIITYNTPVNTISWTKKALKQIKRIDRVWQLRIIMKVKTLKTFPETAGTKELSRQQYGYRLRVASYRILFDFEGNIVSIQEVRKRDERTY